ncbi:MAG: hypothetical protein SGPRY_003052 [Prymnesium sp.]
MPLRGVYACFGLALVWITAALPSRPAPLPLGWRLVEEIHMSSGHRRLAAASGWEGVEQAVVSFRTAREAMEVQLNRLPLWGPGGKLLVSKGGERTSLPLPALAAFHGQLRHANCSGKSRVSAAIRADRSLRMQIHHAGRILILESAVAFDTSSLRLEEGASIVYESSPLLGSLGARVEALHHSGMPVVGLHAPERRGRRQSELGTLPSGPPYGRLSSCPAEPALSRATIGVLVDWGFSSVVGGTLEAVNGELAGMMAETNLLFHDQLGLSLSLGTVIIHLDNSSSAEGGPNYKPVVPGLRESCGAEISEGYASESVRLSGGSVTSASVRGGTSKLLGRLVNWMGSSAPACEGCSHWHLLTDCFPSPGTVGIAFTGSSCGPLFSSRGILSDSGAACNGTCDVRLANGNAASVAYVDREPCPPGEYVCSGPAALTSYDSTNTWRTFAHEVGHTFGAQHTFGLGGLMDYTGDDQFYDNGDICGYLNDILIQGEQQCLLMANAVCGDGSKAYGGAEACDDGGISDGDGCSSTCSVECGFKCSENAAGLSSCGAYCGNGVIDHINLEECDDDSPCCDNCRLAAGAVCSGGECCSGCQLAPSTQPCGASGGFCGPEGRCTESLCNRYQNLTSCAKSVSATCHEHCSIGGTCYDLTSLVNPPSQGYLAEGTPCTTPDGGVGACTAAGDCTLLGSSSCGNGVVESGEECDDASLCCDQASCRLAAGALCSGGECCNSDCSFQSAAAACAGGSGFCRRGVCETQFLLCEFLLDGESAALNTTACPVGSGSIGSLVAACAHTCKRTSGANAGECVSGSSYNSIDYFLPAGTPCNAEPIPRMPEVFGVCVEDVGGSTRSLNVIATLDATIESFDSIAQATYKSNLAAAAGGVTSSDIKLTVSSASIVVDASILTPSTDAADAVIAGVSNAINAAAGSFLGFNTTIAPNQPTKRLIIISGPSSPSAPSAPPSEGDAWPVWVVPVIAAGGGGGTYVLGKKRTSQMQPDRVRALRGKCLVAIRQLAVI